LRRYSHISFINKVTIYLPQALTHFEAAESLNKEQLVDNWLFLAKTYYELSKYDQAKEWATKVVDFPGNAPDLVEVSELHLI